MQNSTEGNRLSLGTFCYRETMKCPEVLNKKEIEKITTVPHQYKEPCLKTAAKKKKY